MSFCFSNLGESSHSWLGKRSELLTYLWKNSESFGVKEFPLSFCCVGKYCESYVNKMIAKNCADGNKVNVFF